jgi:hypothetical protein
MMRRIAGADDAVAGCRVVAENHVTALLAAYIEVLLHHRFDDVAITDLGAKHAALVRAQGFIEAEIAHHCGDQCVLRKASRVDVIDRGDGHDFVAIDDLAFLVAEQSRDRHRRRG